MKKNIFTASLALSLTFCLCPAYPQSTKGHSLSAEFVAAAVNATRAVDAYSGSNDSESNREVEVELATAQSLARTAGEREAMRTLTTFFEDKIANNAMRGDVISKAINATKNKNAGLNEQSLDLVRADALNQGGVREMTRREDDCAFQLSNVLRSGVFTTPNKCAVVCISRDDHAMAQFFS